MTFIQSGTTCRIKYAESGLPRAPTYNPAINAVAKIRRLGSISEVVGDWQYCKVNANQESGVRSGVPRCLHHRTRRFKVSEMKRKRSLDCAQIWKIFPSHDAVSKIRRERRKRNLEISVHNLKKKKKTLRLALAFLPLSPSSSFPRIYSFTSTSSLSSLPLRHRFHSSPVAAPRFSSQPGRTHKLPSCARRQNWCISVCIYPSSSRFLRRPDSLPFDFRGCYFAALCASVCPRLFRWAHYTHSSPSTFK
jgi:hypothetical protein